MLGRIPLIGLIAVLFAGGLAGEEPSRVRVQIVGECGYFQVTLKAPADLRLPPELRLPLNQIGPYELARYPRSVPQDASARQVAWAISTGSEKLEFLGRLGTGGAGR